MTVRLGNTESTANTALSNANKAQSTADTAKENAATAQSTANTANSTANTALSNANKAQSTVDNLEIGGRNLLKDTNILYKRTNADTQDYFYSFYMVDDFDWKRLLGKTLTYSFWLHSPGERENSASANAEMGTRFGCHLTVYWEDSTGVKSRKTDYPLTSLLRISNNHSRVSGSITLTPPEGYDTITALSVATQLYAKPALGNEETWEIGYPKLEFGNKATDWTPAPEDVQSDIDTVQATADKAIVTADVEYYLSTSPTTLSGGTWTTDAPAWVDGKYMWSRTVVTDGKGDKTYSPSKNGTCIAGATGATGATGKGVVSIVEQYYLSTSPTTLSGGSWSSNRPTAASGKYIWTRSVTTYTDGSVKTTDGISVTGDPGKDGSQGAGANLVKNGFGECLDNTNFSNGTFTRGDCPEGCYGYFTNGTTEDIPYDFNKEYVLEYYYRKHAGSDGKDYFSVIPKDIDGNIINFHHVPADSSLYYLSEDLKPGDTVVHFTDLSKWHTTTTETYQRGLLFFGYKDSTGYTYPDGTYSRYTYRAAYNSNEDVDKTANTITLKSAWTGKTFKAGTCVSRCTDGSTYLYYGHIGKEAPDDWEKVTVRLKRNSQSSIQTNRLRYAKTISIRSGSSKKADYAGISLKEEVGVGIESKTNYYLATSAASGVTTSASGWTNSVQSVSLSKKYLWNYEITTYTNGTTSATEPCIIGTYGDTGAQGYSLATYISRENFTEATWDVYGAVDHAETWVNTSDLRNGCKIGDFFGITGTATDTKNVHTLIYRCDNSSGNLRGKCITHTISPAGKSIGTITNYYLATSAASGVTTSTSGWTPTVQSVSASKKYLWNYEVIKYSDGTTASTSTPCIIGTYGDKGDTGAKGDKGDTGATGATGATGNGISSITEYYQVSTSNTTAPTTWGTTVPAMTATNKYLWNYEKITYTNGSTKETSKRVIGVYGDKGATGAKGDKGDTGATGATGATGPKGDKGDPGKDANEKVLGVYSNGNTNMYIDFLTLEIIGSYANTPISFRVVARGYEASDVQIMFVSSGNTDPALLYFRANGTVPLYIVKVAASTWHVIMKKNEVYGSCIVNNYYNPLTSVKATWTTDQIASLPSGYITASCLEEGRTATNYLDFSKEGLIVGDLTSTVLGRNVRIGAETVDIRNGDTVLASYGDDFIYLGVNSKSSKIDLCNGTGLIYNDPLENTEYDYNRLVVHSDHTLALDAKFSVDTNATYNKGLYAKSTIRTGLPWEKVEELSRRNATIEFESTNLFAYGQTGTISLVNGAVDIRSIKYDDSKLTFDSTGGYTGELSAQAISYIHLTPDSGRIHLYGTGGVQVLSDFFCEDVYGYDQEGNKKHILGLSSLDNLMVGYGLWKESSGDTVLYGNDVRFNVRASENPYRPYYKAGDSITVDIYTAGFISSSAKNVYFTVPLARSVIGSPTVSVSSVEGLHVRHEGKYMYGGSASKRVVPASYSAAIDGKGDMIRVIATMGNTTDTLNNSTAGITASIKITFS